MSINSSKERHHNEINKIVPHSPNKVVARGNNHTIPKFPTHRTRWSLEAEAIWELSLEKAMQFTACVCADSNFRTHWPVSIFQTWRRGKRKEEEEEEKVQGC